MKDNYYAASLRISWISISTNLLISLLKFIIGFFSNSISILSDAAHSLSDFITSVIVIYSIKVSRKPPDKIHPFGHGRAEDIGGLILSLVLILIGFNFFKDSVFRLFHPQKVEIKFAFIIIILITALIKIILGFFTQKISKKIVSPLLKTDALHHYSDVVTSLAVGGGLFFIKKGYVYIDSFVGIFVSLIIILWGANTGREFINNLIGRKESAHFYKNIRKIALAFRFVEGVHDVEVYSYGKNKIISLHIEISPSLSLEEAHSVADSIEKEIYNRGLGRCVVHVDVSH
jgi:cation diffusion facilitator family transporter